jgi:hypothetical protein
MAWPTPKVSIAFDDGPYVASPTWTDITEYVYSANVSRGRSDDYSQFIGTAQVVLNNNSRLFDPFNTAGTYYGKLLPRRQIKIEGISNSVTYSVFRGFVDGFPAAWDQAGKFATTTLSCFDAISLISAELLPDYVYDYTKSLSPTHYWRCNDTQNENSMTDDVGGRTILPVSGRFNSTASLAQGSTFGSIALITSQTATVTEVVSTTGDMTIAGWISNGSDGSFLNNGWLYRGLQAKSGSFPFLTGSSFDVTFDAGKIKVKVKVDGAATSATCQTNTSSFGLPNPLYVVATYTKATGLCQIYINGVNQTSAQVAVSGTNLLPMREFNMGVQQAQEIAIFNTVLSGAQITNLYNFNQASVAETSAARMTRLLGYTSLDASLKSVTASPVASVSQISPPGSNLVAEMQLVNNSEDGDLFVTRAGVVKFTDRNYVYTNTTSNTSQATFAAGSIPFEPSVQINYDAQAIRNDITVTFSGGGQTSTTNTASVTAYGTNAMNTQTQLSTQAQAVTLAAYEATVNGQLLTNISPLSVGVTAQTADWTTLMQLDLLDRYTLTVQPPSGNSISQTELINRIEHRIVPGQWQMTVDGSARYTAWFILDQSTINGTDLLQ